MRSLDWIVYRRSIAEHSQPAGKQKRPLLSAAGLGCAQAHRSCQRRMTGLHPRRIGEYLYFIDGIPRKGIRWAVVAGRTLHRIEYRGQAAGAQHATGLPVCGVPRPHLRVDLGFLAAIKSCQRGHLIGTQLLGLRDHTHNGCAMWPEDHPARQLLLYRERLAPQPRRIRNRPRDTLQVSHPPQLARPPRHPPRILDNGQSIRGLLCVGCRDRTRTDPRRSQLLKVEHHPVAHGRNRRTVVIPSIKATRVVEDHALTVPAREPVA
jgi:hypothetical protein